MVGLSSGLMSQIDIFAKNKSLKSVATSFTNRILGEDGQLSSTADADCAQQAAFEDLLKDANEGKLTLPNEKQQAFLMTVYKNKARYYLLKRYHRRSHVKNREEYAQEIRENEKQKEIAIASVRTHDSNEDDEHEVELSIEELETFYVNNISKYHGSRFDKFENEHDFSEIGSCIEVDFEKKGVESLLADLKEKGASEDTIQLICYRLLGYTFAEISEKLSVNESTITKRFKKKTKELGLDPKVIK